MDKLPKYMKIWFQALLQVYDEMEEELASIGRSSTVSYAKNAVSILTPEFYREGEIMFKSICSSHHNILDLQKLKITLNSTNT